LFGQAVAVKRCGVEESDACIPGGLDNTMGVVVRDGDEQVAEKRGAQAEARDLQPCAA